MKDMLTAAGFDTITIDVKANAADIIKEWMPGSGAEQYVTSVYVMARKPPNAPGMRDNVKVGTAANEPVFDTAGSAVDAGC